MDAGARSESSGCMVKWEAPHCQRKTRPGTGWCVIQIQKCLGEACPLMYREVLVFQSCTCLQGFLKVQVVWFCMHWAILLYCCWVGTVLLFLALCHKGRGQDELRSLILDSSLPLLLYIVQEVEIEISFIVSKKQLFFSKNQPNVDSA